MDKAQFKKLLKPMMKECIKELLMEQGMLKVLSEIAQPKEAKQQNLGYLEPQQLENVKKAPPMGAMMQDQEQVRKKIEENRKRMLESIGKSGYVSDGFNPFAGTSAIGSSGDESLNEGVSQPAQTSKNIPPVMNNIDPNDPGVNISGIMNLAAGKWKAHMGGKGK